MLETKAAVNWDVCEAIEAAQGAIAQVYWKSAAKAVVTSARDGKHSKQSAHDDGNAIDLRIVNLFPYFGVGSRPWWERVLIFAKDLSIALENLPSAGRFDVVLERDHIHVEHSVNRTPNIINWKPEQFIHVNAAVRAILEPKGKV